MALTSEWQKSERSNTNGACVEVRQLSDNEIQVRDSKNPLGPVLTFTAAEWDAFVDGAKDGEFNI